MNRIVGCPDDAYDSILDVKEDTEEEDKKKVRDANFVLLGCLLHPKYSGGQTEEAFNKLLTAGQVVEVDDAYFSAVKEWNGEEDIMNPQADEDEEEEEEDPPQEDSMPIPPDWIKELYENATNVLRSLWIDPNDAQPMKTLKTLNDDILDDMSELTRQELMQWQIPAGFFQVHYKKLDKLDEELKELDEEVNKSNETIAAVEKAKKTKIEIHEMINARVERQHFPEAWRSIHIGPKPERSEERNVEERNVEEQKVEERKIEERKIEEQKVEELTYPWHTAVVKEGTRIIGVRRYGRGHQVCIEKEENGHLVRRLDSASRLGLLSEVEEYCENADWKNLSEGQSKWTYKNRKEFVKLLWIATSQRQLENTAAPQEPPIVRGAKDARDKIKELCEQDSSPVPWDLKPVSTFYNPTIVKRRRKIEGASHEKVQGRDLQARENFTIDDRFTNMGTEVLENETPSVETMKSYEATIKRMLQVQEKQQQELSDISKLMAGTFAQFEKFMKFVDPKAFDQNQNKGT
ncbi:hypothetical protein TrVFT333_000046 [Trichoderma virens FT-333]|nr:hypothetical protein TrVFT333_000046 [Trichoderma virens FT-333]